MLCKAPGIIPREQALPLGGAHPDEFGFLLDDVAATRTLNRSAFTYYPDPTFETFGPSGILEIKPGSHVVLKVLEQSALGLCQYNCNEVPPVL